MKAGVKMASRKEDCGGGCGVRFEKVDGAYVVKCEQGLVGGCDQAGYEEIAIEDKYVGSELGTRSRPRDGYIATDPWGRVVEVRGW